MALAELIGKLRSKKQAEAKTASGHYLELVRSLASGAEVDSDEVAAVLKHAGKTEDDFTRSVEMQQERLQWLTQIQRHEQAKLDYKNAEEAMRNVQERLQKVINQLTPEIQSAEQKMKSAEYVLLTTQQAESRLTSLVLDTELLEREATAIVKLREVNSELKPLEADRTRKQTFLSNLESRLAELQGAAGVPWLQHVVAPWLGRVNSDINATESQILNVRSELQQLEMAIKPRQAEQARLQAELNAIHAEKLKP